MDTVDLSIESLAYGGSGVARLDGRVVFVPGTTPGDLARVRLVTDHGSWLEGEMTHLVEAGAGRVEPPCPIAHECGGCPWQHVDIDTQLAAKQRAVTDALVRIAGIEDPPVREVLPSPDSFGYRNRLHLRFEGGRIGFFQARSKRVVPVSDCLIADDVVRAALPVVERFLTGLTTRAMRVEIASRGILPGVTVAVQSASRLRHGDTLAARQLIEDRSNPVRGLVLQGRGWTRQWGDPRRRFEVAAGIHVDLPGASFGQVNTGANLDLVRLVAARVTDPPPARVVELYAGAGNFSLAVARVAGRVLAVEADADAVEAGRAAAAAANLRNVRFTAMRAERWLAEAREEAVDVLLVDPPRSGLGAAAGDAALLGAPRIVYVSCNPTTLARDLRVLTASGYRLREAAPVDLFPQTFHVETVCTLELT